MSGFDVVCIKELILRREAVLVNVLSGFLSGDLRIGNQYIVISISITVFSL